VVDIGGRDQTLCGTVQADECDVLLDHWTNTQFG
jgi:hypothetical protein